MRKTLLAVMLVLATIASGQTPEIVTSIRNRIITTVAGGSRVFRGAGGPADQVAVGVVFGLAADRNGDVYVASREFHVVLKVDREGIVTIFAGNGIPGVSGDGGPALQAAIIAPDELALGPDGSVYISTGGQVRKVERDGNISTLAGPDNLGGGMTLDPLGNLYVADRVGERVLRFSPEGESFEVIAGTGERGSAGDGGPAIDAELDIPTDVAVSRQGDLYISSLGAGRIRRIADVVRLGGQGVIDTVVGEGEGDQMDGPVTEFGPTGDNESLTFDELGNLYFGGDARIFRADPQLQSIARIAGQGNVGFGGDGGRALDAVIDTPSHLAVDGFGSLFASEYFNHRVRKIEAVVTLRREGRITTFAGDGRAEGSLPVEPAIGTMFTVDFRLATDSIGTVFIADHDNNVIRAIAADGISRWIAGNGDPGFSGDGEPAALATINKPAGIAVDDEDNIFFLGQDRLRKIDPEGTITTVAEGLFGGINGGSVAFGPGGEIFIASTRQQRVLRVVNGVVEPFAGTGEPGFGGDGGPALDAQFNDSHRLAVGPQGAVYVSDALNYRIRRISSDGIIDTVAGGGDGPPCSPRDGVVATSVALGDARGIAMDSAGNVVFGSCHLIHLLTPDGLLYTIAGMGGDRGIGDGGPAIQAVTDPADIAIDRVGNIYIADWGSTRVRKILAKPLAAGDLPDVLNLEGFSEGPPASNDGAFVAFSAPRVVGAPLPIPGTEFTARVVDGAPWLSVDPVIGQSPRRLTIAADPATLPPGEHRSSVEVRDNFGVAARRWCMNRI